MFVKNLIHSLRKLFSTYEAVPKNFLEETDADS